MAILLSWSPGTSPLQEIVEVFWGAAASMAVISRGLHATLRTDRALHKRAEVIQAPLFQEVNTSAGTRGRRKHGEELAAFQHAPRAVP